MVNCYTLSCIFININFNDRFIVSNHWIYSTLPSDEPQYKCMMCDRPIYKENEYCSNNCFEASQL